MFSRWMSEGIPQGLKPLSSDLAEGPKAEALRYLEAKTTGREMMRRILFISFGETNRSIRRWVQAGLVCLLAVVMLGATPDSRFEKAGHEMICTCGCGQVLLECNHVGCPVSPVMIGELHAQIDGGGSDTSIFNWFEAKYGATVLAAPIRGGFDNVAWIAPMAVFLLATIGTGFLVRMWSSRSAERRAVRVGGGVVGTDAMRERIRRETEY